MNRLLVVLLAAAVSAAAAAAPPLSTAIKNGDFQQIRTLVSGGADVNQTDDDGTTPLMHAAIYSTLDCMKLLLDKGANVNAVSKSGRTALMSAIAEPEKVRLLLGRGADPNAKSAANTTPLVAAARLPQGEQTAMLLLAKGAQPSPQVWTLAAAGGHQRLFEALGKGQVPSLALLAAATGRNTEIARMILEAGVPVDFQAPTSKTTALQIAAFESGSAMVKFLLDHGAKPDLADSRGYTALMMAAGTDYQDIESVKLLLAAGADPKRKDMFGDSAVDWAAKLGDTPVARLLGARPAAAAAIVPAAGEALPSVRDAVQRAVKVIQPPGPKFFELNQCISCHHTSIPQMAFAKIRNRGIEIDAAIEARQVAAVRESWKPRLARWQESMGGGGGFIANTSYGLLGLAAASAAPDDLTTAAAHALAGRQFADGSWYIDDTRPPLGVGRIKWTALVLRAIQLYGPPGAKEAYEERIARARGFLERAQPADTQGHVFRLLGLKWAGAKSKQLEPLARQLEQLQRADGGWSQRLEMQSDAYATAQALWALNEAAGRRGSESAFQRGANYLRRTQLADGSWHVKNRAFGFQPLKDTGFPHGRDQWISSGATGFAILALAPLIEEPKAASNVRR